MKTVALWVLSLSAALLQVPARAEYNGPALDFPMLPWGGVKINVKPGGYRTHQGNSYYAIDFDHLFDAQGRYDGLDDYAVAAADGVVTAIKTGCVAGVLANGCGGYGNNVVVDMGGGYTARYGHFTDVFVAEGPIVRGQILGTIGSTGDSSGPHLHFEVKYNGAGGADVPELEDIEVGGIRFVDYQEVAPRYPPQRLICSDGDCQWSGRLVGDGAAPGIDVLFREAAFKTERFFSTINPRLAGRGAVLGWPKSDASGLVRNVRGVLIQELHQPVDANRMVASDGDTGLALGPDMENRRAFLLRGGFWGVYRCLADAQGRGAGASYLGAPLEEESERYLGVCVPRRYQGDPFYDAYLDMLCRTSTTRQRFERGYMDWSGTQVHVHLNDVDDRRAWEIVNTLEGCYPGFIRNSRESSVVPNPPVAVGQPVTPAVRVVPPVGGQGTLFQQDGAGFSLNGNVRLSFRYPDGHVETVNRVADGRGEYRHSYQSNAGTPVGNYEYWATDLTTGLQSPRVPFSIQRGARYVEGFPYKGSQRPDVCYYTGGTCYVIESEPVYWQMFPGDLGFDRMVVIPQAEFDALVAGAPCVVGAEYDDPAEPGCIIHDESLNGDNDYFVVLNGEARRMNETSARSCFDERRIFNFRLLAWATAWHDDPRPFFTFADQAEAPYYCDPGSPPERVFCDDCGEQERRCNANTCRPFLTECRTQCEAAQACIEGECIEVQRLIAGRIVSPADGAVVSNAGFTVRWEPGSASNGAGTGTGLYCRVNGGAWDLRAGFGDNTERGMPNYAPGTRIECKVRTRLNSDYATWVDSAVVGWTASDASAQMRILGITLEDDPGRDACDIIRFSARVRNEGVEEEGWEARVFLHRVGGSPEDADAVEGERSYTVVVAPGQENDVPMVIDPALPIPVGVGLEMTLRLADEARGLGEPVQMTIPLEGVDVAPPVIERFDVYGVGGEPEGLIAGRSQAISLQVRDEYQLDEVQVEWRTQGGAWAPAQLETARRVCERSYFTAGSFDLPGNLAAGTLLEIRLRVVDLAGHVTERVLPAQVRVPNTPVVRFVTPVGGERHRYSYRAAVDCVQTRFFVSSPIPIRTLSFGLGSASARDLPTDVSSGIQTERTTVNPIPADGWVEGCVRTGTRGDDIRVVVRIYDDNREYHYFVSPPVTIDDVKPPAPWGELRLEPSQRRRPVLADGSRRRAGLQRGRGLRSRHG